MNKMFISVNLEPSNNDFFFHFIISMIFSCFVFKGNQDPTV